MKIVEVTKNNDNGVYFVKKSPNWLERLFGRKVKTELYKKYGTYYVGGGGMYHDQKGNEIGPWSTVGDAIDKYERSF